MKRINIYINEKLQLTNKRTYTCQPKDKYELRAVIIGRIKNEGHDCDLNDIDVSKIDDMSNLFNAGSNEIFEQFNGDISLWDMSNVRDMEAMFSNCENFNVDISKWNISNVKNIRCMFFKCKKFNQNLNSWNISNIKNMQYAFFRCPTQPTWYDKDKWED